MALGTAGSRPTSTERPGRDGAEVADSKKWGGWCAQKKVDFRSASRSVGRLVYAVDIHTRFFNGSRSGRRWRSFFAFQRTRDIFARSVV